MATYVTSWERIAMRKGEKRGIKQGIKHGIEQGIEQGRVQGREQGLTLGTRKGAGQIFLITLTQKFGPPPVWVEGTVAEADPDQIAGWASKILTSNSLEELFSN